MKGVSTKILVVMFMGFLCLFIVKAEAHFQMLIPSDDIVEQGENQQIQLDLLFNHPFEYLEGLMNMEKPEKFGVVIMGKRNNLIDTLKIHKIKGLKTWKATYKIKRPGDHIFYVIPKPYWEQAEEKYIIHITKVVVNAFGMEEGWNKPVGLKAEILPLTRPYGLWAGNTFCGKALVNGKPAAHASVEVEYYNEKHRIKTPSETFNTQVITTDDNGIFTYTIPWDGWWGFAVLTEGEKINGKDVEIGAVMWVRAYKPIGR